MRRLLLSILLASLFLLLGADISPSAQKKQSLALTLTSDKTEYAQNEVPQFIVSILNESNQPLTVTTEELILDLLVERDGKSVTPSKVLVFMEPPASTAESNLVTLQPGQSTETELFQPYENSKVATWSWSHQDGTFFELYDLRIPGNYSISVIYDYNGLYGESKKLKFRRR